MSRTATICTTIICTLALSAMATGGVVGHWQLDEGSGDVAHDSSGNGNDGAIQGASWMAGGWDGTGYALDFDGQGTNRIALGGLDVEGSQLSIACWFKADNLDTPGNDPRMVSKATGGANDDHYWMVSSSRVGSQKRLRFRLKTQPSGETTELKADAAGEIVVDEWIYAVATWDGDTMRLYKNGEEVGSIAKDGTAVATGGSVNACIGNQPAGTGDRPFDGLIDNVLIADRAMTAGQIADFMNDSTLPDWKKAMAPSPADGAIGITLSLLTWEAGDDAALHEVYLSTTPELTDADLAMPRSTAQIHYQLGLEPGVTYYWRVDEIAADGTVYTGDVWHFTMQPLTAYAPAPADEASGIFPAPTLRWQAGQGAMQHHLYFSDTRQAVENGLAEADKGTFTETRFDAGLLRSGNIYYWRVDETTLGGETHTGEVWSFRTNEPAEGRILRQWWLDIAGTTLSSLTNDPRYPHSPDGSEMLRVFEGPVNWEDSYGSRLYGWLIPPETGEYTFWISSDDASELRLSTDGDPANAEVVARVTGWTSSREWDKEDGQKSEPIQLQAGQSYYVEAVMKEGGGGDNIAVAWQPPGGELELIRGDVISTFAQAPLSAAAPSPADGAVDTIQSPILSWFPGEHARQHDVYFGQDAETVADADTSSADVYQGQQAGTAFDPGALEWGATYYWRVDEINADEPGSPWTGPVWSFTTADFLPVDDFESYDDDMDAGTTIYETWIDGVENGSGSYVGYENATAGTFGERSIVHGGSQSMPLTYDNTTGLFYSEAVRTWSTPQDWTDNELSGLTLFIRGDSDNEAEPLYVALEDGSSQLHRVMHPDPDVVTNTQWIDWTIPLSDFSSAGVDLSGVKTMYIGLGQRDPARPGGAGQIYVDDVRVTGPQTEEDE